ncbi:MAG: hypothetical protein ACRD1H_08385, partial [Vicinamibacterales bacterium]
MQVVTPQHNPGPNALFGADDLPSIVSVERFGDRQVRLYQRGQGGVRTWLEPFRPWLVTTREAHIFASNAAYDLEELSGAASLALRVRFDDWSSWHLANRELRDTGTPVLAFGSPAEQYL